MLFRSVAKAGCQIVNIDSVVICERPKINPHREEMKKNIAKALKIDVSQVGVKASTSEKLGFTGRMEGIASQAVASVRKPLGKEHF